MKPFNTLITAVAKDKIKYLDDFKFTSYTFTLQKLLYKMHITAHANSSSNAKAGLFTLAIILRALSYELSESPSL
jgi:hypothetical protein